MQLAGPLYRLLGKPLPAVPFKPGAAGDFNVKEGSVGLELINRMTDAAEKAHKKLVQARKEELSRTDIISVLEPILPEEFGKGACRPRQPCPAGWKDVEERQASIMYLSSVVDLSEYKRKVYIDGGANTYDSSIGGWFFKSYPQASTDFEVYAFEADMKFKRTYPDTGVSEFIPYAMWTHNTTVKAARKRMFSIYSVSVCLRDLCLAYCLKYSSPVCLQRMDIVISSVMFLTPPRCPSMQ